MGIFSKKPTEFDTSQDKQLSELAQRVSSLEKTMNQVVTVYNKGFQDLNKQFTQKEAKDKQQDAQLADFINCINNDLKQLKANAHNHAAPTEQT